MPVRVMSNPAQLLLAGNPRKSRKRRATKTITPSAPVQYILVSPVAKNPVKKAKPVSKKKRKSPAARAARAVKRRAKRASRRARKGVEPAGLKRWRLGKKKAKSVAHRPARKAKRRTRRAKMKVRRQKVRRRVKNVFASAGARVVVRKVRRGAARKPSKAQRRRARRVGVVGVNAGALTLQGGLTNFIGNAKATMKDGVKGFAFAFAGAGGAVAGGAFMSRITYGLVAKVAPSMLQNPIVSRLLAGVNYYLPGWALATFIPGLSGKSRRAMLTGAAAAALMEVVRPGVIRNVMVQVPVIGGLMGTAEDSADDLGAYISYALSGDNNMSSNYAGSQDDTVSDYVALNDYESTGGMNAAQNMGVEDYVAAR